MDSNIWDIKNKEKICCFDIDGVLLSDYPNCWIEFLNKQLNTNYTDLNEVKRNVAYDVYRKTKEQYRLSGIKETFYADIYAKSITARLKELGYTIVIMSARPVNNYPTLYQQTINWLNKNNITFDLIYFGEKDKHAKILCQLPHLKFMVEDNSYIANQISHFGYKVFLLKNKYNYQKKYSKNVIPIDSLCQILSYLDDSKDLNIPKSYNNKRKQNEA